MWLIVLLGWIAAGVAQEPGRNLVPNPGFEQGGVGWDERGQPIVLDRLVKHGGEAACQCVGHEKLQYPHFHWVKSADIPAEPNRAYRFSLAIRGELTKGTVEPCLREVGGDNKTIRYHAIESLTRSRSDWRRHGGEIITSSRAHHLQVYLIVRDLIGTVWYDDVELVLLPGRELPPFGQGRRVIFPGGVGALPMAVEEVSDAGGAVEVRTTGARYRIAPTTGEITGWQRIGEERQALRMTLRPAPGALRRLRSDRGVCVLGNEHLELGFQADSLLVIAPSRPTRVEVTGGYGGRYVQRAEGHVQVIDDDGGVNLHPYLVSGSGDVAVFDVGESDLTQLGWTAAYDLKDSHLLGVAIYPPRPFDWAKSFDQQVAHTGGYPSDKALESWSRYVTSVCLHESIWAGGSPISHTGPYTIADAAELKRVKETCERLGLKLIVYMSPYFYVEIDPEPAAFMAQLAEHKQRLGFHGIYYDGVYSRDWIKAYTVMRLTREMFPDGPVYLHTTIGAPLHTKTMWCPFVDTYADYTLRGEGHPTTGADDPYLRYVAAGYRLSNAIGFMKGDKWDLPADRQLEVMLRLNGRARLSVYAKRGEDGGYLWAGDRVPLDNEWTRTYRPALQRLKDAWRNGRLDGLVGP